MLGTTGIQMDSGINTSAKPTTKHPNSSGMWEKCGFHI
jgi:hypothetical protein